MAKVLTCIVESRNSFLESRGPLRPERLLHARVPLGSVFRTDTDLKGLCEISSFVGNRVIYALEAVRRIEVLPLLNSSTVGVAIVIIFIK